MGNCPAKPPARTKQRVERELSPIQRAPDPRRDFLTVVLDESDEQLRAEYKRMFRGELGQVRLAKICTTYGLCQESSKPKSIDKILKYEVRTPFSSQCVF